MEKINKIFRMIKFEHSVFALPFAFMSAFLAEKKVPGIEKILLILLAMVSARSTAMAFNRLVDLRFDKKNPRTIHWVLSRGELTQTFVKAFIIVSALIFFLAAYFLNLTCFVLSPVAMFIILTYSLSKRFTFLTHFYLGLALSLAPMGAWLAITEQFAFAPILLSAAVMFWTAGFDIIYATQDISFDQQYNLHSIPVRFGIKKALLFSSLCHLTMIVLLGSLSFVSHLGLYYLLGIISTALFLLWQHRIVKPSDLSKVNEAFFTANGLLSVFLLLFTMIDIIVK
ncbi:MAG: 4-hydroxybenzoate octaprenyltransferase [Candidatus Fischerbacteria bacterium RBG_13_37_8]|uniref:4-hydroxybenzoate polyprenyltransferase n=1 Tax=Candidatus Fischerbacteria bacterium RBG_13_37_8 TaxID=1817863 RepID=A0A1F5VDK0_9BACT|nr:MAG: 4-hydroxybenzoate octaprenyltransferase [Candidatus Fischerbacteria bacterium RBG_13_37_8]